MSEPSEPRKQYKFCFNIDKETDDRIKALHRQFNLSKKLREALDKILDSQP